MGGKRNNVMLIGKISKAPKINFRKDGVKQAVFYMKVSESKINASREDLGMNFIQKLIALGRNADIAELYLQKDTELMVQGKLFKRNPSEMELKEGAEGNSEIEVRDMVIMV